MLATKPWMAFAAMMSGLPLVVATPGAEITAGVVAPERLPDDDILSTRCGTRFCLNARDCPNTQTEWHTHIAKCTTTTTCLKTTTEIPDQVTSTETTCEVKIVTDSTVTDTATETKTTTSTTTFNTDTTTTETEIATSIISVTTIAAPNGFLPVQTTFPDSDFVVGDLDDGVLGKRDEPAASNATLPVQHSFAQEDGSAGHASELFERVICDEWHGPRECETVTTTCTTTVTEPTPTCTVTATTTCTTTTTPYATVTSTITTTSVTSVTDTTTQMTITTSTTTITAATLTTSYAACQTDNFANRGPGDKTYGDTFPQFRFTREEIAATDPLTCCIFANVLRTDSAHWILTRDGRCVRVIGRAGQCPPQGDQTVLAGLEGEPPTTFGNGLCGEVTGDGGGE